MKNTYKWRASNIKYVYISDVNTISPFIYDRTTGIKTFYDGLDETTKTAKTRTEEGEVNEIGIKDYVSKLTWEEYSTLFTQLVYLSQTDSDCAKIQFADVSYYYNTEGDECQETTPSVPCECYIPKFIIESTETLPYGTQAFAEITHTDISKCSPKEIYYYLALGIPEGMSGVNGGIGAVGPSGKDGANGKDAKITIVDAITKTIDADSPAEVVVTTGGTPSELELHFEYSMPKGEQGPIGEKGEGGSDGVEAWINSIVANAITVDSDKEASAQVVSSNTYYDETTNKNLTDLTIQFEIPKGEVGERGETGDSPKISSVTAEVVETLSPDASAYCNVYSSVTMSSSVTESGIVNYEPQYSLDFKFGIPMGQRGDRGETGPRGEKGESDYIYIDSSGGTSSGTIIGGSLYNFENPIYYGTDVSTYDKNSAAGWVSVQPIDGTYNVRFILKKSGSGGGADYDAGSGITISADNVINANSEATTVSDITCSSGAPCDARGVWENDIVPSGTTIQEVLEKILCREIFPSPAIKPHVELPKDEELGLFVLGSTVTLDSVTMSEINGEYVASYTSPSQPNPVSGVTWTDESISVNFISGFTNNGLNGEYTGTTVPSTTAEVRLGDNIIKYIGGAAYTKPSLASGNYPLTNLGNETTSTVKVTIDDKDDNSAIWDDDASIAETTKTAIGVYPIYTNITEDWTALKEEVDVQFPILTSGNTITIENVPSEVVNEKPFAIAFPERDYTLKIKGINGEFVDFDKGTIDEKTRQYPINGYTCDYRIIYTNNYSVVTATPYNANLQGISTYQITFDKPLNETYNPGEI